MTRSQNTPGPIRYAVVGIGHIAQIAVLPAFAHAKNSKLVALVSSDAEKLEVLGEKYGVERRLGYDEYDVLLASGEIDAVYIALPNDQHCDFTERAARAGVHVLCEKPMGVDSAEGERMIRACAENNVKLMIAYRLHFEEANLSAIEAVRNGEIGTPRFFDSAFSMQVREGNIRTRSTEIGGGPLHDLGIYCINAARGFFGAEPLEVFATSMTNNDPRFSESQEMISVTMRFPEYRIAQFIASNGADAVAHYRVTGTDGVLEMSNAYEYHEKISMKLTSNGEEKKSEKFGLRDQFAPELMYFSNCILDDEQPEPDGFEGLRDMRIIDAALLSVRSGKFEKVVQTPESSKRQSLDQEMKKPPVKKPELVNVESGSED